MRLGITILLVVLLVLTVPWFFVGGSDWELAGWPAWVGYTLGMNLVFALVTTVLLRRAWKRFERTEDSD